MWPQKVKALLAVHMFVNVEEKDIEKGNIKDRKVSHIDAMKLIVKTTLLMYVLNIILSKSPL